MKDIEKSRITMIVDLHNEIGGYMKMTIDKAIEIGGLLAEQKAEVNHGQWLPWVKDNLPFSERWARDYMRFYEKRDKLKTAKVADLTEARRLIADSKPSDNVTFRAATNDFIKAIKQAIVCKDLFAPEAKQFIIEKHNEIRKLQKSLERTLGGVEPELEELRVKFDTAMNELRYRISTEADISQLQTVAEHMREIGKLAFSKLAEKE